MRRLRTMLDDRLGIRKLVAGHDGAADTLAGAIALAASTTVKLGTHHGRRTIVGVLVRQVRIEDDGVVLTIDRPALLRMLDIDAADDAPLIVTAPAVRIRHGKDVKLVLATSDGTTAVDRDGSLTALLAEARAARDAILTQPTKTIKQRAGELGQCRSRMANLVRLSWLSPEIVQAIADGRQPPTLTPRKLLMSELPFCWTQQKAMLGIA